MEINTTDYYVKERQLWNGVVEYICVPKLQECGTCHCKVDSNKMTAIKYPLISDGIRHNVEKIICNKCYPQVKEILKDNPYK